MVYSFELQAGQSLKFIVAEIEHFEKGKEQRIGQKSAVGDVVAVQIQMRHKHKFLQLAGIWDKIAVELNLAQMRVLRDDIGYSGDSFVS